MTVILDTGEFVIQSFDIRIPNLGQTVDIGLAEGFQAGRYLGGSAVYRNVLDSGSSGNLSISVNGAGSDLDYGDAITGFRLASSFVVFAEIEVLVIIYTRK